MNTAQLHYAVYAAHHVLVKGEAAGKPLAMRRLNVAKAEYESRQTLFDAALNTWGIPAQVRIAIEEMAELIQALSKNQREHSKATVRQVTKEIADVRIMLDQLTMAFDHVFAQEIDLFENEAIKRLEHALNLAKRAAPSGGAS